MILKAEPDIEVVGEAGDGREAIAKAERLAPDVVLMDIRMPGLDGIAATGRITAREHAPRVLVLTTFDRDEYVYDALRAGASAFLFNDGRCPAAAALDSFSPDPRIAQPASPASRRGAVP